MWTLLTGINLRPLRRRFGRLVLGTAVLVGTGSQLLALLPAVTMAAPAEQSAASSDAPSATAQAPAVPAQE